MEVSRAEGEGILGWFVYAVIIASSPSLNLSSAMAVVLGGWWLLQ